MTPTVKHGGGSFMVWRNLNQAKSKLNQTGYYSILHTGGARGVMVIVAGYGHGDASSNPGPD